jgi:hypothetical protein
MTETKGKVPTCGLERINVCRDCSGKAKDSNNRLPENQVCEIAKLELILKRPPTADEVNSEGRGWFSAINIPDDCPKGYRSPDSLPLR